MKIEREGEGFRVQTTPAEASIAGEVEVIAMLLADLQQRGFGADERAAQRKGQWRYSQAERSLEGIRNAADKALLQMRFLDFPEADADKHPPQ